MHYQDAPFDSTADTSIKITQAMFVDVLVGEVGITDIITSDQLSIEGSTLKLLRFFSLLGESNDSFNIVLP